jgi:gas vesicle protein
MTERHEDHSNGGAFLCGLLTGVTLGAGLAMLFAPKPGTEFRRDLAEGASDLGHAAKDTWEDVTTTATGAVQKGREAYNQTRKTVQNVADSVNRSVDGVQAAVKDAANAVTAAGESLQRLAGGPSRH